MNERPDDSTTTSSARPEAVEWLAPADPQQAAQEVVARFADAFGGTPDGVWAAPGRVNLIGEHLDYNGGPALPLALAHRTLAAVRRREDDNLRLVSVPSPSADAVCWQGRLEQVAHRKTTGWGAYAAGVAWALGQAGHDVMGLDIALTSTVPLGSGLSSSAALQCAVAVALADLLELPTDDTGRAVLVDACVRGENDVVGAPTGGMDQTASLRATAGHALLMDGSDGSVQQVPLDLAGAGLALLVMDTRAPHRHADGKYAARRAASERAAAELGLTTLTEAADLAVVGGIDHVIDQLSSEELRRRARHVITEVARVHAAAALLHGASDSVPGGGGDLRRLGPLLDASHTSLRDDYEVSSAQLDTLAEAARAAGAHGARMTGGGFGGSAIALVDAEAAVEVAAAARTAALAAGHPKPGFLLAEASSGAGRVR